MLSSDGEEVLEGPLTEDDAIVERVDQALTAPTSDESRVLEGMRQSLSGFVGGATVDKVEQDKDDPTLFHISMTMPHPVDYIYLNLEISDEQEPSPGVLPDQRSGEGGS